MDPRDTGEHWHSPVSGIAQRDPLSGYGSWESIQVHVWFSKEQISSSPEFCPCLGDVSCQRPWEVGNIAQGCFTRSELTAQCWKTTTNPKCSLYPREIVLEAS